MQVPILSGIYSDANGDYRTSHPRNMVPVPKQQGISNGYLRPAPGIVEFAEGPGIDRGGWLWNGLLYRVMGTRLVSVSRDGVITDIGDVGAPTGADGQMIYPFVRMTNSFDHLAIESAGGLHLYDGTTLTQVTDPNLGTVLDVIYLDGYFVTTDGEFLVTGELGDPFTIPVTRFGSSEIDPDPVVGLIELRNEIAAVNRHTVEFFDNVGGGLGLFPFRRIEGAQLERGAISKTAMCKYSEAIAFVGNGDENEAVSIWIGRNGQTTKISTREIDQIIRDHGTSGVGADGRELAQSIKLESRTEEGHETLYMHLSNETWCYDLAASAALQRPVWYVLDSPATVEGNDAGAYLATSFIRAYDMWIFGNTKNDKIGTFRQDISTHFGESVAWNFQTSILYNEGQGFNVHEVKLQGLTGRAPIGAEPIIFTQFSNDSGSTFSKPKPKNAARNGDYRHRLEWSRQGDTEEVRIQRFYGTSDAHITIARLDMTLEALSF